MGDAPFTVEEVAARWRVSEYTVAQMTRDGRLARIPGLRRTRIPRQAVYDLEARYDVPDGQSDRTTSAKAPPSRRRHRVSAEGPLAAEAVGGGGAVLRRAGPSSSDVVVRRVEG